MTIHGQSHNPKISNSIGSIKELWDLVSSTYLYLLASSLLCGSFINEIDEGPSPESQQGEYFESPSLTGGGLPFVLLILAVLIAWIFS